MDKVKEISVIPIHSKIMPRKKSIKKPKVPFKHMSLNQIIIHTQQ